jgi:16S rRNA (guanine966-N2)-methyltransferase
MRVLAGELGGRKLSSPPADVVRPTTERVREALFDSLTSWRSLQGSVVLDLFAGTGALGIEALSRGASGACFVERSHRMVSVLRENLGLLGLKERSVVISREVLSWLRSSSTMPRGLPNSPDVPLVVFADPPYGFAGWVHLIESLVAWGGLPSSAPAILVAESQAIGGSGARAGKRPRDTEGFLQRAAARQGTVAGVGESAVVLGKAVRFERRYGSTLVTVVELNGPGKGMSE